MIFKFFEMHLYGTHIMCIAIRQPKTLPDSKAFTYHSPTSMYPFRTKFTLFAHSGCVSVLK